MDRVPRNSIYAMGNSCELTDAQCKMAEILSPRAKIPLVDSASLKPEEQTDDITIKIRTLDGAFRHYLRKPGKESTNEQGEKTINSGGLLARLRVYLNFDIEYFSRKKYNAEKCKFFYLFYIMEHTAIVPISQGWRDEDDDSEQDKAYFYPIKFLSKPSMESTSYALSRRDRYNGGITDFIKNELEKEIALKEASQKKLNHIKNSFKKIVNT